MHDERDEETLSGETTPEDGAEQEASEAVQSDDTARAEKMAKIRAALAKADGEEQGGKRYVSHAMDDDEQPSKPAEEKPSTGGKRYISHAMDDDEQPSEPAEEKPSTGGKRYISHAMDDDEPRGDALAEEKKPYVGKRFISHAADEEEPQPEQEPAYEDPALDGIQMLNERKKAFKVTISDEDYGYPQPSEEDEESPKKKKKKSKKAKKSGEPSIWSDPETRGLFLRSIGAALVASLVIGYFVVAGTYRNRLLPNTFINSVNVSGMTAEEAAYTILNNMTPPDLRLTDHNNQEALFKAESFDAYYSIPLDEFEAPMSENPFAWVIKLFSPSEYNAKTLYLYDPEKLRDLINTYEWGDEYTVDAHIVRSDTGDFTIAQETLGDQFDSRTLMTYLYEQLKDGRIMLNMMDSGCYEPYEAKIRVEDLQDELVLYNSYAKCTITFDFDDRKKKVESEQIVDWIQTLPDGTVMKDQEGKLIFDKAKVGEFVSQMAAETDTYGKSRSFHAVVDQWITVPWNGDYTSNYGWKIDQDATVNQLCELMRAGESVTVEPEYEVRGYCRKTDDIGSTYIEVDISEQHIWMFRNNILVFEADTVSGTETNAERRTPRGICKIWSHERNRTLGTYAVQGYECPVSFWMPFNYTGCGFHDLARGAYGGQIYMYNGSHGCLNMAWAKAKELYELTENDNGIPVIVHD